MRLQDERKTLQKITVTIETALIVAIAAAQAEQKHFTWWGIAVYTTNNAAYLIGKSDHTWIYAATIALIIIAGVITMSIANCTLLRDAHTQMGPAKYAAGNFMIHYYPLLGTVAKRKNPAKNKKIQAPLAVATFIAYAALTRPEGIYGCTISYNTIAAAAFIAATAVTLIIAH